MNIKDAGIRDNAIDSYQQTKQFHQYSEYVLSDEYEKEIENTIATSLAVGVAGIIALGLLSFMIFKAVN